VVQGIPVIVTASDGFTEIQIKEGVGSEVVAPVTLPGFGRNHGLTPRSNMSVTFEGKIIGAHPKR
jgi:hypothetical protein